MSTQTICTQDNEIARWVGVNGNWYNIHLCNAVALRGSYVHIYLTKTQRIVTGSENATELLKCLNDDIAHFLCFDNVDGGMTYIAKRNIVAVVRMTPYIELQMLNGVNVTVTSSQSNVRSIEILVRTESEAKA